MGLSGSLPDSTLQPGVCTSTTRPSNPFVGQCIYETDTTREMLYDGSTWRPRAGTTVFATSSARDAAIPSPTDGQSCYLISNGTFQIYTTGHGWQPPWQSAWGVPDNAPPVTTSSAQVTTAGATTKVIEGARKFERERMYEITAAVFPVMVSTTTGGRVRYTLFVNGVRQADIYTQVAPGAGNVGGAVLSWYYSTSTTLASVVYGVYLVAEGNTVQNYGDANNLTRLWSKDIGTNSSPA